MSADAQTTANRLNFIYLECGIGRSDFLYRGVLWWGDNQAAGMRFLPYSRASIDHAPGPIIASVPPSRAKTIDIHALLPLANAIQSPTTARNPPAMGVQKPTMMNSPRIAAAMCGAICAVVWNPLSITVAR